jgi:hypothetical protein
LVPGLDEAKSLAVSYQSQINIGSTIQTDSDNLTQTILDMATGSILSKIEDLFF